MAWREIQSINHTWVRSVLNKTPDNAISLSDIHLTLGEDATQVHVLKGITLDVLKGTSTGIVGPSGSGKSTLLMVIAGLERVDSGHIKIAGENITDFSEDELASFRGKHIGIVFQSFHLIPNMTALENVAVPLELSGDTDAMNKAGKELEAVGLGERKNHYPGQLSGGEQQRVAIARALVNEPTMIFADEPTGNLDSRNGDDVMDILLEVVAERNATLVVVTHDQELSRHGDRTLTIKDGAVA